MKALTLTQPWATLVAIGAKMIETRSWGTYYRGRIAIHAAKGWKADDRAACLDEPFATVLKPWLQRQPGLTRAGGLVAALPHAAIVAVAALSNCYRFDRGAEERIRAGSERGTFPLYEADFGNFAAGRFGLLLANVQPLFEPIPVRGALGLWNVPADIESLIDSQLAAVAS